MRCEDCIHFAVCYNLARDYNLSFMWDDHAETCTDFKDKSKIIELPCKVGDKIFNIEDMEQFPNSYDDDYILCFVVNDDGLYFETECYQQRKISEIGKTVFLTKKAAEQALKGCKHGK